MNETLRFTLWTQVYQTYVDMMWIYGALKFSCSIMISKILLSLTNISRRVFECHKRSQYQFLICNVYKNACDKQITKMNWSHHNQVNIIFAHHDSYAIVVVTQLHHELQLTIDDKMALHTSLYKYVEIARSNMNLISCISKLHCHFASIHMQRLCTGLLSSFIEEISVGTNLQKI